MQRFIWILALIGGALSAMILGPAVAQTNQPRIAPPPVQTPVQAPRRNQRRDQRQANGLIGEYWLTYAVSIAGLPVAEAFIVMDLKRDEYNGLLDIKTSGLASLLTNWNFRSETAGRRDGAIFLPNEHITRSERRDRVRQVEIFYSDQGPSQVVANPPLSLDADRSPLTDDMRVGTLDLLTAILVMVQGADTGAPCGAPLPVHDGRHRFDIVSAPIGNGRISGNAYRGPAQGCEIRVDAIGGFKQNNDDFSFDKVYEIWFADPLNNGMQIIASMESDLSFGRARVSLTGVKDFQGRSLLQGR